jgi:DNA-binding PadR family transcriptional regulator
MFRKPEYPETRRVDMGRAPDISSLVPLTPRVLLILWALADGPQHGYRVLKIAEELGRGLVSIGPASLYEAINTLRNRGLIEQTTAPPDVDRDDARRRYFRLTSRGHLLLKTEANRLAALGEDLRRAGLADSGSTS